MSCVLKFEPGSTRSHRTAQGWRSESGLSGAVWLNSAWRWATTLQAFPGPWPLYTPIVFHRPRHLIIPA